MKIISKLDPRGHKIDREPFHLDEQLGLYLGNSHGYLLDDQWMVEYNY